MRKVRWVSEKTLEDIVAGSLTPAGLVGQWMENRSSYERVAICWWNKPRSRIGLAVMEKSCCPSCKKDVQHNQIDRQTGGTGEGLLFYEPEKFFASGGMLWALARAERETMETRVRPAFRYLANTGLGANRSSGKGQFDFEVANAPALPDAGSRANAFLSLSRYLCASGELGESGPLAYRLISLWPKREQQFPLPEDGRRSAPVYKRRIRVFEPGSVFPLAERRPYYGQLATLIPEGDGPWPVYQSGFTLPVFIHVDPPVDGGLNGEL